MKGVSGQVRFAAQEATLAVVSLLNICRGDDPQFATGEAEEAVGALLNALKATMELAGFDPDERERGQLYRAIADYVGDQQ